MYGRRSSHLPLTSNAYGTASWLRRRKNYYFVQFDMNIFVTDPDPRISAQVLPDKHIVKMPLETCQMASVIFSKYHWDWGTIKKKDGTPYRTTGGFWHHPCTSRLRSFWRHRMVNPWASVCSLHYILLLSASSTNLLTAASSSFFLQCCTWSYHPDFEAGSLTPTLKFPENWLSSGQSNVRRILRNGPGNGDT